MMQTTILEHKEIVNKLQRIAWQIFEANYKEEEIVLAGIKGNGFILAQLIAKTLIEISPIQIRVTELVVDKTAPFNHGITTDLKVEDFSNKVVILIDDVINSGKTMMYGLKYFLEGPLKKLNTVVLVDRNHNRFPIRADFTGMRLSTSSQEHVKVTLEPNKFQAVLH